MLRNNVIFLMVKTQMNEQRAVLKCFPHSGCTVNPQVPVANIVNEGHVKDVLALMGMKPINIKGNQMMDAGMAQDLVDFAEYGKEVLSTRGTEHSPVSTTKDMEDQIIRLYKLLVPDDPASDLQKQQAANVVDKTLKDTSSNLQKATQATLEKVRSVRSAWSMGHAIDRAIRSGTVSDATMERLTEEFDLATPEEVLPFINKMVKDLGPTAMADELNSRLQAASAPSDEEIANQRFLRDMSVKAIVGTGLAVAGATMYVATGGRLPQGVQNLVRIPRGIFNYLGNIRPDLRHDFEVVIGDAMAVAIPVAQEPVQILGGAVTRSLANGPQAMEIITDAISEAIQDVNGHPQTWEDVARAFEVIEDFTAGEGGAGGGGGAGTASGIGIGVIGSGAWYMMKMQAGRAVVGQLAHAAANIGLQAMGVSNPFAKFVAIAVTSRLADHYFSSKEAAHPRGYFPLSLEDDLQYTQKEINAAIGDPGQVLRLKRLVAHEELLKSILTEASRRPAFNFKSIHVPIDVYDVNGQSIPPRWGDVSPPGVQGQSKAPPLGTKDVNGQSIPPRWGDVSPPGVQGQSKAPPLGTKDVNGQSIPPTGWGIPPEKQQQSQAPPDTNDPSWLERLMKILSTGAHLIAAAAATSAGVVWTATKAAAIGTAGAAVVGTAAATGLAAASALSKTKTKTKTKTETRCGCCTQTVRITIEAYE